jgi:hypothetical protein
MRSGSDVHCQSSSLIKQGAMGREVNSSAMLLTNSSSVFILVVQTNTRPAHDYSPPTFHARPHSATVRGCSWHESYV